MFPLNKKLLFNFKTNNYLRTQSDPLHLNPRGHLEQAFPILYISNPVNYVKTYYVDISIIKVC